MSGVVYETNVASSTAVLPDPPQYWSHSALRVVSNCALRFALERSQYPDLWAGRGYPPLPRSATLFGNVVHAALEHVLIALAEAGVESPQSAQASDVLRGLGGLSAVIEDAVEREIAGLGGNPRIDEERRQRLARGLRDQSPDARAQVQTYLSAARFEAGAAQPRRRAADSNRKDPVSSAPPARGPLARGSHAEVHLVAERLRLHGRVDLLTLARDHVEIVDFKTGAESPEHKDQLWFYALLWQSDELSNPTRLPVAALRAAYSDHTVDVPLQTVDDIAVLAGDVAERIVAADRELASSDPRPSPSSETCRWCSVRQLCGAYWRDVAPSVETVEDGDWFDLQGVVGAQHGPHSWWLGTEAGGTQVALLRSSASRQSFAEGEWVRFVGLRRVSEPESTVPVAVLAPTSEAFRLTPL